MDPDPVRQEWPSKKKKVYKFHVFKSYGRWALWAKSFIQASGEISSFSCKKEFDFCLQNFDVGIKNIGLETGSGFLPGSDPQY